MHILDSQTLHRATQMTRICQKNALCKLMRRKCTTSPLIQPTLMDQV